MRQALLLSIWQLSAILLLTSQVLSGWMGADAHFQVSPEIFDWVQAQTVVGPLKDIHRAVYKTRFLCAYGHCLVGRWICPVWGSECSGLGFHEGYLNIFVHWAFLYSDESLGSLPLKNSPTAWGCYQHNCGEDWVWPHQHKAQIGGVLQWCLSFCRFLLSPHMIMELS